MADKPEKFPKDMWQLDKRIDMFQNEDASTFSIDNNPNRKIDSMSNFDMASCT